MVAEHDRHVGFGKQELQSESDQDKRSVSNRMCDEARMVTPVLLI